MKARSKIITRVLITIGCLSCLLALIAKDNSPSTNKENIDNDVSNSSTEANEIAAQRSESSKSTTDAANALRHLIAAHLHAGQLESVDALLKQNLSTLGSIGSKEDKRDLVIKLSSALKPFSGKPEIKGLDDPVLLAIICSNKTGKEQVKQALASTLTTQDLTSKAESEVAKCLTALNLGLSMIHNKETSEGKIVLEKSLLHASQVPEYKEKVKLLNLISESITSLGDTNPASTLGLQINFIKEQSKPQIHPAMVMVDKISKPIDKIKALSNFASSLSTAGDTELTTSTLGIISTLIKSMKDPHTRVSALTIFSVAQSGCGLKEESAASLKEAIATIKEIESISNKSDAMSELMKIVENSTNDLSKSLVLDESIKITNEIQQKGTMILNESLELASTLSDKEKRISTITAISEAFEQPSSKVDIAQQHFQLGSQYQNGVNFERNPKLAAEWYQKAALLGHQKAQVCLALILMKEQRSQEQAITWLTKAANQGDAEGQASLGMLYALGKGVKADLINAHKWITLAADQGNEQAIKALKKLSDKLSEKEKISSLELVKKWKGENNPDSKKAASKEKPKEAAAKA